MLCPNGFDEIIWNIAENMAITNKTQAETYILEIAWETTYSEMVRKEIHHNLVSSIEELTKEWYEFATMMIHHKDPYWIGLLSLTKS